MTQQTKLAATGVVALLIAKFLLHKEWKAAALIGTAAIAGVALLEARNVEEGS